MLSAEKNPHPPINGDFEVDLTNLESGLDQTGIH